MPRKDRNNSLTRGEQLPKPSVFLRKMRSDYAASIGSWACDSAITEMHDNGLLVYPKSVGIHGKPHIHLRAYVREAVLNSMIAASDVYRGRQVQTATEDKLNFSESLVRDLNKFLAMSLHDNTRSPEEQNAIVETEKLIISLHGYIQNNKKEEKKAQTRNFLHSYFVKFMHELWLEITGKEVAYPYKRLLIELALGIWIDAKLPDHDIEEALLRPRIQKWFAPKRNVSEK